MKNLFDYINEGLLDDIESQIATGNTIIDNSTIGSWAVGEGCRVLKKRNGYKIIGNFKMSHPHEKYDGPKIIEVAGDFAISGSQLKSLEGLFDTNAVVSGTLTIENNAKLVSLAGSPTQVGTLTVTGNINLKDLTGAPSVLRNAYISKNGKRFNKEKLSDTLKVNKHIFCNLEDDEVIDESMVNEAFKAPQLKLIADAIKKASGNKDKNSRFTFSDIMTIHWDRIEASQVTELDVTDPRCIPLVRKYAGGKADGIFAVMDKGGEIMFVCKNRQVYRIHEKYRYGRWGTDKLLDKWNVSSSNNTLSDIADAVKGYDTVIFISFNRTKEYHEWSKTRIERNRAQLGALALQRGKERTGKDEWGNRIDKDHVRYYQQILTDNRDRYKKMLTEIKAKRAAMSNNFTQIKTRLDRAFDRYTALLAKILISPAKYNEYDIEWLNDEFGHAYMKDRYSMRETGLFKCIEEYMSYVIKGAKGELYNNKNIAENMKKLEENIFAKLDRVEAELTKLESI